MCEFQPMVSVSNNEIKRVKSLQNKKFRDESGLFVVEGEKMVDEALKSRFKVEDIYYRDEVGDTVMSRMSALSSPSPVLAIVRKPDDIYIDDASSLGALIDDGGLFLALDVIRDPGNLGTIIRMADWFGIKAVFAAPGTVDVFNPKVVQSTMGAVFRVNIHYTDIVKISEMVRNRNGRVYGTFLDGNNIYRMPLDNGNETAAMIVIGNESEGISKDVSAIVTDRLYIPPYPQDQPGSESLNAAIATAVTLSEFRRRL